MGWSFLVLATLIWLLGTNYQNNLILALAYFQISLLVICILHTYKNLAGIRIKLLHAPSVFAEENALLPARFVCLRRSGVHHLVVFFYGHSIHTFDLPSAGEHEENIQLYASQRGWLGLPYLCVESVFPMGLFKCGSWLRFDTRLLVYPKPVECDLPRAIGVGDDSAQEIISTRNQQEFYGFRRYQPGESVSSIAWKQYARGKGLLALDYVELSTNTPQLDLADFDQGNKELAISHLCYWVLKWSEQGRRFNVRLQNETLVIEHQVDVDLVLGRLALM